MRNLKPSEIQCRAQVIKDHGFSILLYKDARVDMNILDEEFGPKNWKDSYQEINGNLFCTISIWDSEKEQWISKQDAGSESNTEKEKGHASDAFKRAGFRWGIGRELYSAPFIWINAKNGDYKEYNGKKRLKINLYVSHINVEDGVITELRIKDDNGNVRYKIGNKTPKNPTLKPNTDRWQKAVNHLAGGKVDIDYVKNNYNITEDNLERLTAESLQVADDASS